MRLRLLLVVLLALATWPAAFAQETTAGSQAVAAPLPRKVISWVPPYGIAQAQTQLAKIYGASGYGPRNGLTHLALQFWTPTTVGGVRRETFYGTITNATIRSFVSWGHANGIKVMLCVYNYNAAGTYWDWPLAQAGFRDHQTTFINQLIDQMQTFGLDGIDIDLEGAAGDFEADKPAYVAFVAELARRAHQKGKIVTVDSFPWKWNAPNWNWWAQLFPHVDGINSMGYEDLGRTPLSTQEPWRKYSTQKAKAGNYSAKLQIGIPSYLANWQGSTALAQVQWFKTAEAARVGVAIWDAQFPEPSWKSAIWQALGAIRKN